MTCWSLASPTSINANARRCRHRFDHRKYSRNAGVVADEQDATRHRDREATRPVAREIEETIIGFGIARPRGRRTVAMQHEINIERVRKQRRTGGSIVAAQDLAVLLRQAQNDLLPRLCA